MSDKLSCNELTLGKLDYSKIKLDYITWPEVFITGDVTRYENEKDEKTRKLLIVADCLLAWGHILAGNKPPVLFGEGLVKLGIIFGDNVTLTKEKCMELAQKIN